MTLYNIACTPIARQQVGKQVPAKTGLGKQSVARLCNNRGGYVFYVARTTPSAGNGPMNSQSDTWHVFSVSSALRNNRIVFSALSVPLLYNTSPLAAEESPGEFLDEFRG
jgi:hypothetical protein